MEAGDVVVSFNDQRVQDPGHLVRLVFDAPIGSTARVGVIRNGKTLELRVAIVAQREFTR
jgi:S1-C subfamily serine protease